jgi:hypothetical protein
VADGEVGPGGTVVGLSGVACIGRGLVGRASGVRVGLGGGVRGELGDTSGERGGRQVLESAQRLRPQDQLVVDEGDVVGEREVIARRVEQVRDWALPFEGDGRSHLP